MKIAMFFIKQRFSKSDTTFYPHKSFLMSSSGKISWFFLFASAFSMLQYHMPCTPGKPH